MNIFTLRNMKYDVFSLEKNGKKLLAGIPSDSDCFVIFGQDSNASLPTSCSQEERSVLLTMAEHQAMRNNCSVIYAAATNEEEELVYKKMGYKPCPFSFSYPGMAESDSAKITWFTKERLRCTPVVLTVYTGATTESHTTYKKSNGFANPQPA